MLAENDIKHYQIDIIENKCIKKNCIDSCYSRI